MRPAFIYEDDKLAKLTRFQRDKAWDLEASIDWNQRIDLTKPLVPLDEQALFFPHARPEERLAISQMMGLIIAACICELEDSLMRLRPICWEKISRELPVSPEFVALGDQFFEEESKHTAAFRRYLGLYAEELGIDLRDLGQVLPVVEGTRSEALLRSNLERGGASFWWIVAAVEQVFLVIYRNMRPFRDKLEPLYFSLHEKHFEEEVRHTPFPYLMIELISSRSSSWRRPFHALSDHAYGQLILTAWTISSLNRARGVVKLAKRHPFFARLARIAPDLDRQPAFQILWRALTRTPYVSTLANPGSSLSLIKLARQTGALHVPFPAYNPDSLVDY